MSRTQRHRISAPSSLLAMVLGVAVFPSPSWAQSADEYLTMCKRDAKNAFESTQREAAAAKKKLADGEHDWARYVNYLPERLTGIEGRCVKGPMADKMRGLPGYDDVTRTLEAARALLADLEQTENRTKADSATKALAAGPGGDSKQVRARWGARPDRCSSRRDGLDDGSSDKDEARGKAKITGLEEAGVSAKRISKDDLVRHNHYYSARSLSLDEHLDRIACGVNVFGIDEFASDRPNSSSGKANSGAEDAFADALLDNVGDASHRVLYKAVLADLCFSSQSWDVRKHYGPFLFCAEALGDAPTLAEVGASVDKLLPNKDFEKANLLFMAKRGLDAYKDLGAAFASVEAKYPRMKAVFRDSAAQARKRYNERRARYAAAYRIVDPITARMFANPASEPPADCEAQLLGLRETLAAEIKPTTAEMVKELRVGHPLGYQITEALTYCYLGKGKLAKASLQARALRTSTRRVSLAEEMYFAREDALRKAEAELLVPEKLIAAIPNYEWRMTYAVPLPVSLQDRPRFDELAWTGGKIALRGGEERKPAVVASMKVVDAGVQLVFKKFTHTYKYRAVSCRDTTKVDYYDVRGSRVTPVYRKDCEDVGPVKTEKVTFQEATTVIPAEDAALVKEGMQLTILVNPTHDGDAAILSLGPPGGKLRIIDGVVVR